MFNELCVCVIKPPPRVYCNSLHHSILSSYVPVHCSMSAIEIPNNTTLPDRHPMATVLRPIAILPLRHSEGSQSKSFPATVTQVLSVQAMVGASEDCHGIADPARGCEPPITANTPQFVTIPRLSGVRERTCG